MHGRSSGEREFASLVPISVLMKELRDKIKRKSIYLVTEFVIIFFGVLVALAVDEWRRDFELEGQRTHIIESLLVDLNEDRIDYRHFVYTARQRAEIAQYLIAPKDREPPRDFTSRGEGLFQIGISGWLQIHRGAFNEMNATGARITIVDDAFRSKILRYYALATDRYRVNLFIAPELERYHAALERLGVAYSDRDDIDVDLVLGDPAAVALIKNLGQTASFAAAYCDDLVAANQQLIADLEAQLAAR